MEKHFIYNQFALMPKLETPRLLLRRMYVSDARDMFEYASLPAVTRYLTWEEHTTYAYTQGYLAHIQELYRKGEGYDWAVVWKEEKKMIGTCGFTSFDTANGGAEVGYVLNPAYWGRGIAAEALWRVMQYAFEQLGLHRLQARCMEGNAASARVMEKCHMRYEGTFCEYMLIKGHYTTVTQYAILDSEYRQCRAQREKTE